jgi:hypothetical protein
MKAAAILAALVLPALAPSAIAQQVGQCAVYQGQVIPGKDSSPSGDQKTER